MLTAMGRQKSWLAGAVVSAVVAGTSTVGLLGSTTGVAHGATPSPSAAPSPKKAPPPPAKGTPAKGAPAKVPAKAPPPIVGRTRSPDSGARRTVAGGPTVEDVAAGAESAELRALRDAERELFPPAMSAVGSPWPTDMPSPMWTTEGAPRVHASGLPPAPPPTAPPVAEGGKDLSWLTGLTLPEIPVRWNARVVRYLEFFKDDPRGRQMISVWIRRSGRYRDTVRKALKRRSLPEDLMWVSMVESGFDPTIRSPAGAAGLWQFMPEAGRIYGLAQDRWLDERMSAQAASEAAADFLADLHRRFASWELTLAAYNMGYPGVANAVRKYNTNDYWALCRMEASLPWETTLYVPKIVAVSIVARNLATFGLDGLVLDPPVESDTVPVPPGVALSTVAQAAGCSTKEVEQLNPELRASRTPPGEASGQALDFPVRVPVGRGAQCALKVAKLHAQLPMSERYVVKFGETLEQIASSRKTTAAKLAEVNGLKAGELVRGGAVLLVPRGGSATAATSAPSLPGGAVTAAVAGAAASSEKPVVVVPADLFVYPDRQRVFYRVLAGDTLKDVAAAFHVSVDDLRRWNDVDPSARLHEGMTLQVFAPEGTDLTKLSAVSEQDVRVLAAGSEEFFSYWEGQKGRKRLVVTAKAGDTLESIGRRYGVQLTSMERINRRGRGQALAEGDEVVVYVPSAGAGAPSTATR